MTKHTHYNSDAARWLLLLTAAGITYGSLYPFSFRPGSIPPAEVVHVLLSGWRDELGLPNIVANLILFIPYGLFANLALPTWSRPARWSAVILSGAILAFGIQVVQVWFSGRTPTIIDGFINMAGLGMGMLLAGLPWFRTMLSSANLSDKRLHSLPFLLLIAWLAYRWFPLAPSLDVTALKHSLKPLILEREWRPLSFARNLAAWLAFAWLWNQCRFPSALLWLVIPGSLVIQVLIANNPVLLHNLAAALLAPVLWAAIRTMLSRPEKLLLLLLVVMVIVQGLQPLQWGAGSFRWVPFSGFLTGNMMVNTSSLLEKLFLYGSMVWLTLAAVRPRWVALLLPVAVTGSIEIAQIWLVGRVAEITDPLLCALLWHFAVSYQPATPGMHENTRPVSARDTVEDTRGST